MYRNVKVIKGKRFGKLIAIKYVGVNKHQFAMWLCQCDCGNQKVVSNNKLQQGRIKSCGCIRQSRTKGITKEKRTLYEIYRAMIKRCYKPTTLYVKKAYQDRGIKVCDEWLGENGFINFYEWAIANGWNDERYPSGRHKLTIDRIDNDGNYEPTNCRLATYHQQRLNQRARDKNSLYSIEHKVSIRHP